MEYFTEVLDRSSGELRTVSRGDWVPITELGAMYGAGRRETRTILRAMGFLHVEGGGSHQRHRLCPWVVERGWGKRHERKHAAPFDVVGPDARAWIAARWGDTVAALEANKGEPVKEAAVALEAFREERDQFRRQHGHAPMSPEEMVSWLSYHRPSLTQADVASVVNITQQLVSRYVARAADQRQKQRQRRSQLEGG